MFDVKEQVNRVGREMTEQGLKFQQLDESSRPTLALAFGGDGFAFEQLVVFVMFDQDGESAQLASSPIVSVPMERMADTLFEINEVNRRFRWVRFYLDSDNDIIANCDIEFDELSAGMVCVDAVQRMSAVVDHAYETLAKLG